MIRVKPTGASSFKSGNKTLNRFHRQSISRVVAFSQILNQFLEKGIIMAAVKFRK